LQNKQHDIQFFASILCWQRKLAIGSSLREFAIGPSLSLRSGWGSVVWINWIDLLIVVIFSQ